MIKLHNSLKLGSPKNYVNLQITKRVKEPPRPLHFRGQARNGTRHINLKIFLSKGLLCFLLLSDKVLALRRGQENGLDAYSGMELGQIKSEPTILLNQWVTTGNYGRIRSYVDAGNDVNSADQNGITPLMLSMQSTKKIGLAQFLVKSGANVNQPDHYGNTALLIAVFYNNADAVRLLLANQGRVNQVNYDGLSALMVAAHMGNGPMVSLLLDSGADARFKDSSGRSALEHASEQGYDGVCKILCEKLQNYPEENIELKVSDLISSLTLKDEELPRLVESHHLQLAESSEVHGTSRSKHGFYELDDTRSKNQPPNAKEVESLQKASWKTDIARREQQFSSVGMIKRSLFENFMQAMEAIPEIFEN